MNKNRIPVEIIRCVDDEGNYVLVKKYEKGISVKLTSRRRRHNPPITTYEHESCKLDMPAEFKVIFNHDTNSFKPNPNYQIQMIQYYLDKQDINEYELRNLIMSYLKTKKKEMEKDKFKSVCDIFDKADKMLSRSDTRKNSNVNEADVSYKFLLKSYSKIVELCEVKKKVEEKVELKKDISVDELARILKSAWMDSRGGSLSPVQMQVILNAKGVKIV